MTKARASAFLVLSVAVLGLVTGFASFERGYAMPEGRVEMHRTARYSQDGTLLLPDDYRTWILAGVDKGIKYSQTGEKEEYTDSDSLPFHNVYINREAYESYKTTGKFPDDSVLVMEVFESTRKEPRNIVSRGSFEGKRIGLEAAVKDSRRPDGSKTPWAYYDFTNPADSAGPPLKSARAFPDDNCYSCHLKHADVDNVWVQFYPTLRDLHPISKPAK